LGRESYFFDRFSKESYIVSKSFALKAVIGQLPRYGFEVIAFGGILLIVLYFLLAQREIDQIVPVLSLYTFAGYRILPSLQTIFNKATGIRYSIPSLDILYRDLSHLQSNNPNFRIFKNVLDTGRTSKKAAQDKEMAFPITLQSGIQLQNINFAYGRDPGNALIFSNLNLFIPANTTIGFAGTTGSGKTTLVDIILGLLVAHQGNLIVDNHIIDHENVSQWQKNIGYVPQDIYLTDASIIKNIAFGVDENTIDQQAVISVSKIANIHDFITNELPDGYETVVGERGVRLSGGQKQRIGIARALYHDPQVLILDEATSALDGVTEDSIMQAINKLSRKKTIILIAHRLSTLKDCDQIYLLSKGKVVAHGSYDYLIEGNRYFKEIRALDHRKSN
jgi:ATP-binding cassette, subfamily B, bacterial PglK